MNKLIFATVTLASMQSLTSAIALADSRAVSALKNAIGDRVLACRIKESGKYQPGPRQVELRIVNSSRSGKEVIFATARYETATYSVYDDKISAGSLIIELRNDEDGPHSQDKLEIPLGELNKLEANLNATIYGSDHYYEDWNGTSDTLKMSCEVK